MDKEDKKSGLIFLPVGILSYIALNALMIFLDLHGLFYVAGFDVAGLCIYLAVPILLPVIWAKAANRKIIDSVLFMSMGILAAFMLCGKLSELMVYFHIIPDNFIRGLYEKRYPELEPEFITQEMYNVRMAALYQIIETILLLPTTFTVKIIMKICQINKQFNSYRNVLREKN